MKKLTYLIVFVALVLTAPYASANFYTHSKSLDAAAPNYVYGTCVDSYTVFNPPGSTSNLAPTVHRIKCRLKRNGSTVVFINYELNTGSQNSYTFTSSTQTPRVNNCIYCLKNQGQFLDYPLEGGEYIHSTGSDNKECATTGYGPGGGGSGGEP